jgi:hypothetical protein
MTDDGSLLPENVLSGWGPNFLGCAERAGRPLDTHETMRASIEKAGFVNVQEKLYKCPIGSWPKNKIYKDAGRVNLEHWKAGLEGWAMWLLTKHGLPVPWLREEVMVYVATVGNELVRPSLHSYHFTFVTRFSRKSQVLTIDRKRVWAQKPLS